MENSISSSPERDRRQGPSRRSFGPTALLADWNISESKFFASLPI
jgi:hypothetical protein